MNALRYAGLVGKYVDMARATSEDERQEQGVGDSVGMAGVIVNVYDSTHGVVIVTDYGMGFEITVEHEPYWVFSIWSSEAEAGRR
jgi:hypothetical protein